MTTSPAISIRNLVKRYAPTGGKNTIGKLALNDISFDVPQGQIFGLLGPNGAGKSTLINILAGMVMKTSGSAEIWGFDIDKNPRNAKRAIGIVPQETISTPFSPRSKCWKTPPDSMALPNPTGAAPNCWPLSICPTKPKPMPAPCPAG
jgi:ABC-type multidrug transport system ATPase subunit